MSRAAVLPSGRRSPCGRRSASSPGICLKGTGALGAMPEQPQSGYTGCESGLGGRILAVGNAVGAGVGLREGLWGGSLPSPSSSNSLLVPFGAIFARFPGKGFNLPVVVVCDGEPSQQTNILLSYRSGCPTTANGICNGPRGECNETLASCMCKCVPGGGCWDGALCDACEYGYWGPQCQHACPGGGLSPCSLHGVCDYGRTGNGTCHCYSGHAGPDCSFECPRDAVQRVCGGHGLCELDAGAQRALCACPSPFTGAACELCGMGYWGGDCQGYCPGIPVAVPAPGGTPPVLPYACSGHGSCDTGTGACACDPGYLPPTCNRTCDCVHGKCTLSSTETSFQCQCHFNALQGFWTGPLCDVCNVHYNGSEASNCTTPCPMVNGSVCNGHGVCADGACVCDSDYCQEGACTKDKVSTRVRVRARVCVCATAERRLVADGHVFSLTVCGLTRIYLRPVPVPVLFLLVLGFGRFASSACVCAKMGRADIHEHHHPTGFSCPRSTSHSRSTKHGASHTHTQTHTHI